MTRMVCWSNLHLPYYPITLASTSVFVRNRIVLLKKSPVQRREKKCVVTYFSTNMLIEKKNLVSE